MFEEAGFRVIGEASDGRAVLALTRRLQPSVVIIDRSEGAFDCIRVTRDLLAESPHLKVVCLSPDSDRRHVLAMFAAGAAGYLLCGTAADELVHAMKAVVSGMKYVSPAVAGVVLEDLVSQGEGGRSPHPASTPDPLSSREREVLQLLAEGKSSKEIALRLRIGVATVETHRRHIMDKLNLRTIAGLTKYALRIGLTSLD